MPGKFRNRLPFTKKATTSNISEPPLPSSNSIPLSKWCHSIHDTPLYKFIEVLCDNNLHALVISGEVSEEELVESWEKILQEYTELIGNTDQVIFLSLLKETNRLEWTLNQIETLIEVLKKSYAAPFAKMLCKLLRVRFVFDPSDPEQYDKLLENCYRRSRGLYIDLKLKRIELDAHIKKLSASGELPTREYFINALITLSDHSKSHLTDQMMISEFCLRLKRYAQYVKQLNQK
jgi:hypothetical protein